MKLEISKRDEGRLVRDLTFTVGGGLLNQVFVMAQNYLYDSRYYDPVLAHFNHSTLRDQNSASSFFGLVCWNSLFNLPLNVLICDNRQKGDIGRVRTFERVRAYLPVILTTLNTLRESWQVFYDPRPDNHGTDILMGFMAGAFIWYINRRYDEPVLTASQSLSDKS